MDTTFARLNVDWAPEPNAPDPRFRVAGSSLTVSFLLNSFLYDGIDGENIGVLTFEGCDRYRYGPTNDEGWYRGRCRFSTSAPEWGHFYEISGNLRLERVPNDWFIVEPGGGSSPRRHFLLYFRDGTFEATARDWSFTKEIQAVGQEGVPSNRSVDTDALRRSPASRAHAASRRSPLR